MHHLETEPPGELREIIRCFWYDKKEFGPADGDFEVVPDGFAEIIFYFGSLSGISQKGTLEPLPSPFMIGLLQQPAHFQTRGSLEILGVRCFPWTIFELLGLPAGGGGVRTFDHPMAGLQPILASEVAAGRINQALALLHSYFLNERLRITQNNLLSKAGKALRNAKGTLPVGEIAAAAHATVRTLERNFKHSSGQTVKDVSSLTRFEQARNELLLNPDVSLASLAHELGYTDQSHFSREFKRFCGMTPGTFARNARTNKRM
ncbi:helix-turn-helix domain-containing protein [Dyadobacter sandarakinus]|uniref:AraC family transcriptional regulator n=1 Tax=Dyadobacter sandarakinus TaxID=2747268 RepID=A0ABX7I4Y0_9BACT|nr:helix-turn-helix domain-containing protein [Dyadobacter sandarakinus]QRR01149.1 AraC family transcriptional regulator [Dyadobacter sandarakinus]